MTAAAWNTSRRRSTLSINSTTVKLHSVRSAASVTPNKFNIVHFLRHSEGTHSCSSIDPTVRGIQAVVVPP